jgi:hypothetical protein
MAIGTAVGGISSLLNRPSTPNIATPTTPPPSQSPQGDQTTNAPKQNTSFLATAAGPTAANQASVATQQSGKTLLGQ